MLPDRFGATARKAAINIVLITNAFAWYYLVIRLLDHISIKISMDPQMILIMWTIHFSGIVFSALVGAFLGNKWGDRTRFIIIWMAMGVLSSVVSVVLDTTYIPNVLFLSLFLGASLGFGMPNCMGYFTESTKIEKRGRLAGIVILLSGIAMAVVGTTPASDISFQTLLLSAWRGFGLVFFLIFWLSDRKAEKVEKIKIPSYKSLFGQKSFILYLVPWIIFSLINYLTTPIQDAMLGKASVDLLIIVENVVVAFFAVAGGFLIDIFGRKRVAVASFALVGLGFSVLGLGDPRNMLSWYFYTVVDGAAWGMMYVTFVVTIWGDLSNHMSSDKHYAVGVFPFFVSKLLQFTVGTYIAEAIPSTAIFSFTALFLFLAVLPLVYAPETLPEKIMKDRELKNYIEKAKKEASKAQKNQDENEQSESEMGEVEFEVIPEDEKKAQELAEKYY
jgi:MFS family permease